MLNPTVNANYMGPRPPLFSGDRLRQFVGNYGEKAKDGARTIFASQIAAEGWRDVFDGVRGGIGTAGRLLDTSHAGAAVAKGSAWATSATKVARGAGGRFVSLKSMADGATAAGTLPVVSEAAELVSQAPKTGLAGLFQRLLGGGRPPVNPGTVMSPPGVVGVNPALAGPSEITIGLKFASPAQAREVTTLKIIREPLKFNGVKVPAAGGGVTGSPSDVFKPNGGPQPGSATSGGTVGQSGGMIRSGLAKVFDGMKAGAKNGAVFGGLISAVVNGFQVLTGKKRFGEGVGTVAADTASGAVSGALGAAASGLTIAAAGVFGLTAGLPLTIIGIAGGLLGAILGDRLFKGTGIYAGIKGFISKIFGG